MQNWISKTFSLDSSSPSGIVWRISPNPRIKAGQSAGTLSKRDGYWRVMHKRKSYLCHRIIMLLTTGRDVTIIDHINGVRQDNSVDNLRIVDNGTNARNSARYSSNSSGVTGVKKVITHGGKYVNWQGFLDYNGKDTPRHFLRMCTAAKQ